MRRFAKQQKEEAAATTTDFTPVQLSYAEEHSEMKKKTVSDTPVADAIYSLIGFT